MTNRLFCVNTFFAVAVMSCVAQMCAEEPQVPVKPTQSQPKKLAEGLLFDGKSLADWAVPTTFDFDRHGEVRITDGAIEMGQGRPATGICWKGEVLRTNYELTLEAKRISGDDFFCGLTFPVDKSHCTLILGGWGGSVTGLSNINEFSAVDNETTGYVEFKNNQWYRVRLRVLESKIEAWVDKEKVVDVDREDRKFSVWWEQEPMRPLGIASWNTKAALRNIRVERIPVK